MSEPLVSSTEQISRKPSRRWLFGVFAALFGVQILLYCASFNVKPAGDDFAAPLSEIWRGQAEGVWSFFQQSPQPHNYRPLQSLGMYVFGNISDTNREIWIRLLHFSGMAVFALGAMLWFRVAPLGKVGTCTGAAIMFAHPVLVAPIASIDGFSTLFSTGLMWITAAIFYHFRNRLLLAIPLGAAVFIVAMGFKEYALGAVPLACLVVLFFRGEGRGRQPWIGAFLTGLFLSLVVVGIVLVRKHTIPPAVDIEVAYLASNPVAWLKNAGLFGGVLLFLGSSAWAFVNLGPKVYAIVGASALGFGLVILLGLFWRYRQAQPRWRKDGAETDPHLSNAATPVTPSASPTDSIPRWTLFLILATEAASFPAVLVFHVSEMYAAGMIVPFAILVGLAADGFARRGSLTRFAGLVLLAAALVCSALAVRAKVRNIVDTGAEAERQAMQILNLLPADARDMRISVYYPPVIGEQPKRYSVFVIRKEVLIRRDNVLDWFRPNRNLRLVFPLSLQPELSSPSLSRVIVKWNPQKEEFEKVRSDFD